MNSITLKAYGKINLSLDVLGRRPNGYHDVAMIMQTVDIYDTLTMTKRDDDKVVLTTDLEGLTCGEDNLVCRAIRLIKEKHKIATGVSVHLEKKIPMAAGMAGGSSDCSAAFRAMSILFELGLGDNELMEYGVTLGADVPYCIMGGTALSEGIGEILTPLKSLKGSNLVIATPDISVSTPWVYNNLVLNEDTKHPDTKLMLKAVEDGDIRLLAENMYNVLETVTKNKHTQIGELEQIMLSGGAMGSIMSGSGPTVFGIFDSREKAEKISENIKSRNMCRNVYVTSFCDAK